MKIINSKLLNKNYLKLIKYDNFIHCKIVKISNIKLFNTKNI